MIHCVESEQEKRVRRAAGRRTARLAHEIGADMARRRQQMIAARPTAQPERSA